MPTIASDDEITTLLQNKGGATLRLDHLREVSARMQSLEWQLLKRRRKSAESDPGKKSS